MQDLTPTGRGLVLRDVTDADLPVLFEQQLEPEATAMAAFPSRDREAFMAHWATILADETVLTRAIEVDGEVAGNVVSFLHDGKREVGYWIGKEYWGRGIASRALAEFLTHDATRPLYAHVARHNLGSMRVLEKCGFARCGEDADGFSFVLEA
jgi:RimJ/RimL family protein N-acetyltransferase